MVDIQKLRRELKNDGALGVCAQRFGLVGDPTRMKICWLLCHYRQLSVGDIAEILGVSISVVSHSLRRLREHDLVYARREHKKVFYRLTRPGLGRVLREGIATFAT